MWFAPLQRWLASRSRRQGGACRPRKSHGGYRRRLQLEPLEQRTMLAVTFNAGPYDTPFILSEQPQGPWGGDPIEPQIAVNPTNPANVVLSSQKVLTASADGGASYGYGFGHEMFPVNSSSAAGDTSMVFDSQGRLFWANIAQGPNDPVPAIYVVQADPLFGPIDNGHEVSSPAGTGATLDDKPVLASDGTNLFITWARFFDPNFHVSEVLLSRSTDQGQNWSDPVVVSDPNFNEGQVLDSTVSVLSDGSVAVAYHAAAHHGEVLVATYTNDLSSLSFKRTVMTNVQVPGRFSWPGESQWGLTTGNLIPWVIGDPARSGQVYVVFLNYPKHHPNVVFAKSTDFGNHWTTTNIVSGSDANFEALPTAAIDQFGNLVVAWYTNGAGIKDTSGSYLLDVWAKYSTDGGSTWSSSFRVNQDHQFDPPNDPNPPPKNPDTNRIADYFGINVFAGTVYVAWEGNIFDSSGNVTGNQVWTSTFGLKGSLTITDDDPAANTITIDRLLGNSLDAVVVVNGQTQYAVTWANLSSITVDNSTSSADDTINIEKTFFFGPPVTVNEGSGINIVNISPWTRAPDVEAPIYVNGGAGINSLNIFAQDDFSDTWNVTDSTVGRPIVGTANINYDNQTYLTIDGGSDATYNVEATSNAQTTINVGPGNNAVNVQSNRNFLTIKNGFSTTSDAITIGSLAPFLGGTLDSIGNAIFIDTNLASTFTSLVVDDSADSVGRAAVIRNDSITGLLPIATVNAIGYTSELLSSLTILGGSGFNTWNVDWTADSTWISTGTGGADVNVQSTSGSLIINNPSGHDNVIVGSLAPDQSGGTVANINGAIDVIGDGETWLTVDDSGDTSAKIVSMYDGSINGLAPAPIQWWASSGVTGGVNLLQVKGGSGGDNFTVYGTSIFYWSTYLQTGTGADAVNVQSTSGGLYVDNTGGQDTVFLGGLAGGSLANIHGTVNVFGAGSTSLYVDDRNDTSPKIADLYAYELFGLSPAPIYWTSSPSATGGVTSLQMLGGSGGNTFNVYGTGDFYIHGILDTGTGNDTVNVRATIGGLYINNDGGSDTVTIGSLAPFLGGTLANINGFVYLFGPGPIAATVDDSGDTANRTATLSSTVLADLAPALIFYGNAGSNVTSLTIDAGSGNDALVVASAPASTQVTYNGGGGTNTMVGPNTYNTWKITAQNAGTLNGIFTFSGVQNLFGGTGVDVFAFTAAGQVSSIDGNSATGDWLDYSSYTAAVSVNLATGQATGVTGAISHIQNVHGSNYSSTLTGNALGNILIGGSGTNTIQGGSGRSLLIAGTGLSNITGGSGGSAGGGGDILIGGFTAYDTMTQAHEAALASILAEWQSADSYDVRFNDINKGPAYSPGSHLNGNNLLNWGTTVLDNGTANILTAQAGAAAVDWFFANEAAGHTLLFNFEPGEHKNNT